MESHSTFGVNVTAEILGEEAAVRNLRALAQIRLLHRHSSDPIGPSVAAHSAANTFKFEVRDLVRRMLDDRLNEIIKKAFPGDDANIDAVFGTERGFEIPDSHILAPGDREN